MSGPKITQQESHEFTCEGLPRNEAVWLRVDNFDVQIKRTDEGLVIDVFDYADEAREESLASTYAFDCDTGEGGAAL